MSQEEPQRDGKAQAPRPVPVVALGASAGGIEALGQFFDAMPPDSGLAFVAVLHLDPTHESQLAHILSQRTAMPVLEIEDGMAIERDRVYVIAPNASLEVRGGHLRLSKPQVPRGQRRPVDVLFASLAEERQERALAIVLSGTGNNGTHGLKVVKGAGGCTLVQDPRTARFDGMRRSAIDAGLADYVLDPGAMPDVLMRLSRHGYFTDPDGIVGTEGAHRNGIEAIITLLRTREGRDFRQYKRGTLARRIHRRMGLKSIDTVEEYVEFLRAEPVEAAALARDLTITVTGFLRDPEAWEALVARVLAPLAAERDDGAPVRMWVAGCATGEEAYTLAMLMTAQADEAGKAFDLKIFATDSQAENLRLAREGVYPEAALEALGAERRRRFFTKLDGTYEVDKALRELIVFAPHDLLRDPPFSRLDVVTCRNLMIYLQPEAQKRTIRLMHFALREGGALFLDSAETVGRHEELFEPLSTKWRVFRRLGPTRHDIIDFPVLSGTRRTPAPDGPARHDLPQARPTTPADLVRRTLSERFAPASVLVDRQGRAIYFHGATGDYLEPPRGEPTRDVAALARDGLGARLRSGLRRAAGATEPVAFTARIRQGASRREVLVTIAPVEPAPRPAREADRLLLVSFQPVVAPQADVPAGEPEAAMADQRLMEEELRSTRAELRITIEQMESANEELKAANEEVTSMNEELQSTNEELETSKEELQSFNEELHTINSQLQYKVRELQETTDNLDNLLSGSDLATLFLDMDLRITWFSPKSRDLLDLLPSDVGRPAGSFARRVDDPELLVDAGKVLDTLAPRDAEVRSQAGRWYLRRIQPYRTHDSRIAGVVITFTDITERKAAADAIDEARVFAESIIGTLRQPLLVLDGELRVESVNPAFEEAFNLRPEDTLGRLVFDLDTGAWDIPELRQLLLDILPRDSEFNDYAISHHFEGRGLRHLLLNARRLARRGDRPGQILLAIEDITERVEAQDLRNLLIDELSHRVKNTLATVQAIASHSARQANSLPEFNDSFNGRLLALSRAHDLLVETGWTGSEVGEFAHRTLDAYGVGERITLDGQSVTLRPQAGVAMVMILHELATNAAKYGALSCATGHVSVTWRRAEGPGGEQLHVDWTETAGPRVEKPTRRGFGTLLVERLATNDLHGEAKIDYEPTGLRCTLRLPWSANVGPSRKVEA